MDSFVPRPGAGSLQEKGSQVTVTPFLTEGTSASPPSTHLGPEEAGRWHGGPGLQGQGLNCGSCQMALPSGVATHAVCQGVPLRSFPPLTLPLSPAPLDRRCLGCWALCSPPCCFSLAASVSVSVGKGATGLVAAPPCDDACLLCFSPSSTWGLISSCRESAGGGRGNTWWESGAVLLCPPPALALGSSRVGWGAGDGRAGSH